MLRLSGLLALGLSSLWLSACVQDAKVEDEVPPLPGIHQSGPDGGGEVTAASACDDLTAALEAKRDALHCDAPKDESLVCPGYVAAFGSLPCETFVESSVKHCVARIGAYASCDDFSTQACVITAVPASCHPQVVPEAGVEASVPDSSTVDARVPTDSGGGGAPSEAGQPEASAPVDSGAGGSPADSGHD